MVSSSGWRSSARLIFLGALPFAAIVALSACGNSEQGPAVQELERAVETGYFPGADGLRLFYRKVGNGAETAVYLHGGPWNMSDGGYDLDELADGRTLIAFDQRSGGHSELANSPPLLTADYYLRDLAALRKHFELEQMMLIGQSWGAGLAMLYANQHPEKVSRLLLLSPMPPARDPYMSQRLEKETFVIGEAGVARMEEIVRTIGTAPDRKVAELCREEVQLAFRAYLTEMSALDRMSVEPCEGSPEAIRHQYKAMEIATSSLGNWDFRPTLAKLKVPVLVVEGADTHVPLEATRAWVAASFNGRLLLIPGANHMTWLEGDVPGLMRTLNEFLAGRWPELTEKGERESS